MEIFHQLISLQKEILRLLMLWIFQSRSPKRPRLIKQLSEAKDLAKNLKKENTTLEVRLQGEPVLKLGEKANPKLAKIVTLSNNIEITDLRKLKKLSDML